VDENEIPYNITDDKRNFINDGSNYGGPFVTNPTYIKCDPLPENKYFFSGDYIKNITCNIHYIFIYILVIYNTDLFKVLILY